MKVAVAQLDTVVGDVRGNLERIRGAYARALKEGAEVVLTPELSLCGYPPRDLLEQPDFVRASHEALRALARETGEAALVVGAPEPNPRGRGRPLFNAAYVLHGGRVAAKRFKSLLPTYDVFDEERHFEPARENAPVRFKGRRLGITVCEDAWTDETFWGTRRYRVDPVARQARAGADVLLNI
ncbi:MAG: NAD+ synthase, partial [Elusimicrobia bacterium]|nr:NAD+ synthase [Elusimicrobiota bacterium]